VLWYLGFKNLGINPKNAVKIHKKENKSFKSLIKLTFIYTTLTISISTIMIKDLRLKP